MGTGDEHALHCAARNTNLEVIEILLAADAEVDCTDSLSRTPLHIAATNCNADCVSLLLRSKANPHHRGGPRHLTPMECVPAAHHDPDEHQKVLRLLSSYARAAPAPFRVDTRFDRKDSTDRFAI